jgi:hypothetical protein
LFREWDPIGVSAMDGPEDEYRSYLPDFWRLVSSGADADVIAGYLERTERDTIGAETSPSHRLDVARQALALLAAWRTSVRS